MDEVDQAIRLPKALARRHAQAFFDLPRVVAKLHEDAVGFVARRHRGRRGIRR